MSRCIEFASGCPWAIIGWPCRTPSRFTGNMSIGRVRRPNGMQSLMWGRLAAAAASKR